MSPVIIKGLERAVNVSYKASKKWRETERERERERERKRVRDIE
jgi:hypothetical protein